MAWVRNNIDIFGTFETSTKECFLQKKMFSTSTWELGCVVCTKFVMLDIKYRFTCGDSDLS